MPKGLARDLPVYQFDEHENTTGEPNNYFKHFERQQNVMEANKPFPTNFQARS